MIIKMIRAYQKIKRHSLSKQTLIGPPESPEKLLQSDAVTNVNPNLFKQKLDREEMEDYAS